MIKKSTLIKLAASAGIITGFAVTTQYSNSTIFTPQAVEASSKFRVKLTHNAYIYDYRGKRRGRRVLKKGRTYTAYRAKRIHHKRYYYLGHHNYIKSANAKKYTKAKTSKYLFTVKLNPGAEIDVKPAGHISQWDMYGTVKVYQVQKINNQTWYKVGKNRWVKASETNKNPDSSTPNTNSSSRDYNSVQSSSNLNESQQKNQYKYTDRGVKKLSSEEIQQIKERFIQDVNNWRSEQGLTPFKTNNWISSGSQTRANESLPVFERTFDTSHTRPNGEAFWTAFAEPDNTNGEVTSWYSYQDESTNELADEIFEGFVYKDAASNWGHRKVLAKNYSNPLIGVGITSTIKEGVPYMIVYANVGHED